MRSLLLLAAGVYLLSHQRTDFGKLADHIMRTVELDPRHGIFHRAVVYLHNLHASEIKIAGLFALGYGLLEIVEGAGLWLDKLWAEFLTVAATSILLPFEVYELVKKPSALKAGGIAVNIAIVVYLVVILRRRLRREHALARV